MIKLAKRCPYCAHKLNTEGKCENPKCVAYEAPKEADNATEGNND